MSGRLSVQIIGTRRSANTRKAERFFKERGVGIHLVDLTQRGLSPGELENIDRALGGSGGQELLDRDSTLFERSGLEYMVYDPLEELLKNPLLLRMPVVRWGSKATIGYTPEVWGEWLQSSG